MPTVRETVTEMVQYVFPQYAGAPGQIYGGRMMEWIATAGTLAASPRRPGAGRRGRDGQHRVSPPRPGGRDRDPAGAGRVRRADVAGGGRPRLRGERRDRGAPRDALVAHGVRRHRRGGPPATGGAPSSRPTPGRRPSSRPPRPRREARRARLASRAERARDVADETEGFRWRFEQHRFVFPEDALHGLATCSPDACSSPSTRRRGPHGPVRRAPARDGVDGRAGVLRADPGGRHPHVPRRPDARGDALDGGGHSGDRGGAVHAATSGTTCTAYLTFVKLRAAGGPLPEASGDGETAASSRQREAADKRQAARVARVQALKESLEREPDLVTKDQPPDRLAARGARVPPGQRRGVKRCPVIRSGRDQAQEGRRRTRRGARCSPSSSTRSRPPRATGWRPEDEHAPEVRDRGGEGGEHARRHPRARHPEGHGRAAGRDYEEITYEGYGPGGVARPGRGR